MKRALIAASLIVAGPLLAQDVDLQLPITLDADTTDYDGKLSMMTFEGLRLSQGLINVSADGGRASKLDFQDSVWHFEGNVVIDTENGHIECDTADLQFIGHTLRIASIEGSPATFELQRVGSDETTYAEAGQLEYDLESGVVEFSENAVITEGGNKISSSYLVYNITEQRIKAQSSGDDDERVKITYTPVEDEAAAAAEELTEELTEEYGEEISEATGITTP
ncbi:MAG: LptA/OstA family protein [Woeseiaceae bacterium]